MDFTPSKFTILGRKAMCKEIKNLPYLNLNNYEVSTTKVFKYC